MPILATQNAAAADNWLAQNAISGTPPIPPPPPGARTVAITHVPYYGSIIAAYTDDGASWTVASMTEIASWYGICYGQGQFVVVAGGTSSRTNEYATSPDGVNWTVSQSLPPNPAGGECAWADVAYGNGTFVAVATYPYNVTATSSDAVSWTGRTISNGNWATVAYGAGVFVTLTSYTSSNQVAYSTDNGTTWTDRTLSVRTIWEQVIYLQDRFFALARDGRVSISTDQGVTWTTGTRLPTIPFGHGWQWAAYSPTLGSGQGRLVVVEGYSADSDVVAYSDDQGATWTSTTTPIPEDMTRITWNGSAFIVVCTDTDIAFTSEDGITWAARIMPVNTSWTVIGSAIEP